MTQTGLGRESLETVTLYLSEDAGDGPFATASKHHRLKRCIPDLCADDKVHILFSMRSCPFVCFWIGRWPLYCIISPSASLQFAISSCFCVIEANIDFGEGDGPISFPASKGRWLSNAPIKKKQFCCPWQGSGSGSWSERVCCEKTSVNGFTRPQDELNHFFSLLSLCFCASSFEFSFHFWLCIWWVRHNVYSVEV